ncbi:MAG: type II secretion system F family protein [Planctomycetaceae bacterium]
MDPTIMVLGAAFVGMVTLVFVVGSILTGRGQSQAESRLAAFMGNSASTSHIADEIVRDGVTTASGLIGAIIARFQNLPRFFQQADCPLSFDKFIMVCAATSVAGCMVPVILRSPPAMFPVGAIVGALAPWGWLWWRRRRRFHKFESQLPDALELMSRALRSGHSLASGLNVVASEMPLPIAEEFNNVYEEQNLGIPLDQALRNMLLRIPNLDLRFFVTAVCIQRQSGGDLAEILNKISHLVRERFKILGQVKALTGEGRISGIVLMALPICLFLAVYTINREYVMILFDREEGRKMLFGAVVMQIMGAICIKKIIDIKV